MHLKQYFVVDIQNYVEHFHSKTSVVFRDVQNVHDHTLQNFQAFCPHIHNLLLILNKNYSNDKLHYEVLLAEPGWETVNPKKRFFDCYCVILKLNKSDTLP